MDRLVPGLASHVGPVKSVIIRTKPNMGFYGLDHARGSCLISLTRGTQEDLTTDHAVGKNPG